MRLLYLFFILSSVFFISCKKEYAVIDPYSDIPPKEHYKPEKNLPKEMEISGKYIFTKNNKNFQFNGEDRDRYCYEYKEHDYDKYPSRESIVPIRFRLYDKDNELLKERMPFTSEQGMATITTFPVLMEIYPDKMVEKTVRIWTYIPYRWDGVKIKAVLVDDEGKDLRVLAERRVLPPEEFRKRSFYRGCYERILPPDNFKEDPVTHKDQE